MLQPPLLSRYDPAVSAEGGIDPLGTGATYEHLAERILPHLTARMSRPRFLTAIAVGSHVCSGFEEELASDEVTPAWLVFEWYVAEAFIRCERGLGDELWGIPGVRKVRSALGAGRGLSAASYLKTAKVFGYTGVYRRLAVGLEIISDDYQIDEGGIEILRAWEQDQALDGFVSGSTGPGADLRRELVTAVTVGMEKGATAKAGSWARWDTLASTLRLDLPGVRERRTLLGRLTRTDLKPNPHDGVATTMRREFIGHLQQHGRLLKREDEPSFFRDLAKKASEDLRERLNIIDAYEGLCRPIESAFRYALHASTKAGPGVVKLEELAQHDVGSALAARVQPAVPRLGDLVSTPELQSQVQGLQTRYEDVDDARSLFEAVLEHHEDNQRRKHPNGKRPWFERLHGEPVVRQKYVHDDPPPMEGYVHNYRANTVSTFLRDIGSIKA